MTASTDPDALFTLIRRDPSAMAYLRLVRDHGPKWAYLAAGFVRNRYWDSLYGADSLAIEQWPKSDIDVVYFDPADTSQASERSFEAELGSLRPEELWQVRNQARMHIFAGHKPFRGVSHALEHWSETATAIGVRLTADDRLELVAPFGLDDLYDHVLRPTPIVAKHDPYAFGKRIEEKGWRERWPRIQVVED